MMCKKQDAFWDKVATCKHDNIYPDYCEGFPCANELCRGMATHCKDCKVFIFECACGFENGMSGHPYRPASPRNARRTEAEGGVSNLADEITAAALRFVEAKERYTVAKRALYDYRQEHGSCIGSDMEGRDMGPCYGRGKRSFDEWCEVCQGSEALWEAKRQAGFAQQGALRSLMAQARKRREL